jgi:hypothetical protein
LLSGDNDISAWLRDITGLSNQALSSAPKIPLLKLFEALPIGTMRRSLLRIRIRSLGEMSPFKVVRVTFAVFS